MKRRLEIVIESGESTCGTSTLALTVEETEAVLGLLEDAVADSGGDPDLLREHAAADNVLRVAVAKLQRCAGVKQ